MGNKVILTESAYLDLEEIDDLISKSSPSFSRKFINSIFDKLDLLIDYPQLGKQVNELNNPRIRELLQGKYRIV